MKKLIISSVIAITLVIGLSITQSDINAQSGKTGTVVSLNDEVRGEDGAVSKDEAMQQYRAGQPLVFKSGDILYFVLSGSGSLDTKNLVRNAGKEVTIEGNVKSANGFNYIIATNYK